MATEWPYRDMNEFVVISDDDRDPGTSWTNHRARGSAGGVDCVAAYGTPVYADCAGKIDNMPWYGTAGHTVRLFGAGMSGWYDEYMHVSKFAVSDGTFVNQGDLIAWSGASGNGNLNMYGPHVHRHRYTPGGDRVNASEYFAGDGTRKTTAAAAGQPGDIAYTLETGIPNVTFYRKLQYYGALNGYAWALDGIMRVPAWRGVQTGLRNYGYAGPIDGDPGSNTYKALQTMAHKYGSTDPIDGTLSANDYRAISRRLNAL